MKPIVKDILKAVCFALGIVLFYSIIHESGHIAVLYAFGCPCEFAIETTPIIAFGIRPLCDEALYAQALPYIAIEEIINYCLLPYVIVGLALFGFKSYRSK